MSSLQDLNDPNKTCIYLPAREDEVDATSDFALLPQDLPNGYEMRLEAYHIAWQKCLNRVQEIVRTLHAPIVATITKDIRSAYSDDSVLPGLPYAEVPVIAVSAAGGTNSVIADVVDALTSSSVRAARPNDKRKGKLVARNENLSEESPCEVVVAHVHPGDCPNIMSSMKAIISGFIDKSADSPDADGRFPAFVKRKATTSLASYDATLLRTWYSALLELRDDPPLLVVFMHDFEKIDPNIMQDVFHIFSQHVPSLPLVFVLAMTTPSPSSYLQSIFKRSCLALLRVRLHIFPSGRAIVEEVIQRTFFNIEFQPSVSLGPGVLDFLADFCDRHSPLLDAALSIIQIAYLKHFEDPFTAFVHDSKLGQTSRNRKHVLHQKDSFAFLDSLLSQLRIRDESASGEANSSLLESSSWKDASVDNLVQRVDKAREEFYHKAQRTRIGYHVFLCVRQALVNQGIRVTVPNTREETALEFMSRFARGRLSRDVSHLGLTVKKLSIAQLEHVLSQLYSLFYNLPSALRRQETGAREFITQTRSNLQGDPDSYDRDAAAAVGEWLKAYISERAVKLDEGFLWQVWSTGSTPFPAELINPAPRMTVVNALLHPDEIVREHEALSDDDAEREEDADTPEIWELPDTSILFRRYMEAGKMINVYDWYEAFALELDRQRRENARVAAEEGSKAKGKRRKKRADPEELSAREQEKWEVETHARFIRALQELDFMGFIKHTGRKADHVIRTIYDIPD